MKRMFDFIFALLALILSMALWIIYTFLVWLEDRGTIFYIQDRIGANGIIFKSIKFRTMIRNAEANIGPLQSRKDDKRVTIIGKILRATAMDELPQLLNILKGDMSFVGPRPLRPVEIDTEDGEQKSACEFEGFKERCKVRPGLTGIAQVLAPRDIPRNEKFKYDIWYLKNQSFGLDLKIIFISFFITFMGKWETRKDKLGRLRKWITKEDIV